MDKPRGGGGSDNVDNFVVVKFKHFLIHILKYFACIAIRKKTHIGNTVSLDLWVIPCQNKEKKVQRQKITFL